MKKRGRDPSLYKKLKGIEDNPDVEKDEDSGLFSFVTDAIVDNNCNIYLHEEHPFLFYFIAFQKLTTCRSLGSMGGSGPIPWDAIDRYAVRWKLTGNDYEFFERVITAMDSTYMEYQRELQEKEKKKSKKNNNGSQQKARKR